MCLSPFFHPPIGSVLIFEHHLLHQGSALISGRKYCLRTDVMYDKPENVGKHKPAGSAGASQDVAANVGDEDAGSMM
jgi:hypothetical protein